MKTVLVSIWAGCPGKVNGSFGTAALAANAVVKSVRPILISFPSALALAIKRWSASAWGLQNPASGIVYQAI
jgi:hypothetical protein